jgi:polyribonucleotide nucleotidyltransferase
VEDVVKVGDKIRVEVTDIDNRGKISLIPVGEESAENGSAPAATNGAADNDEAEAVSPS